MRNVRNVAGTTSYLMLLLAAAGAGCEGNTSFTSQESGSVMSLAGALQSAISECAATASQCEAAGADAADARAQCRSDFATCRDAAKEAAKADIDKAVNPCAEAFKGCRADAGDKDQCRDTLTACLGAPTGAGGGTGGATGGGQGQGQGKPESDASAPKESTAPVADCITSLHTCIMGDDPARACTDALRACIAETVGHNGNANPGMPADPGKPDQAQGDGGKPADLPGKPDDAGKPDQPGQSVDAGKPADPGNADAGMPVDPGSAGDSMACKEAREACLSGGGERDACARMLKECRMN